MLEVIQRVSWLPDVRRSERETAARAFLTLLLIIGGHTILETARDALLLTKFPPRALGLVYVAVAVAVLPAAALISRAAVRFGLRRVLIGSLVVAAMGTLALWAAPSTPATLVGLYVLSGTIGATVVPLFWGLVGTVFTVAQGRRLLSPLAAAGVMGGVVGSTCAAWLVRFIRVDSLLPVSSVLFLLAATVVVRGTRSADAAIGVQRTPSAQSAWDDPLVRRIALLVVASTVAVVVIDFSFKWTVARSVPKAEIIPLVARYYSVLNVASLVAQLLVSGAVVRRLGVAATSVVTPLALFGATVVTLLGGGGLLPVLLLRGIDGALRNSVHRASMELVYLPLPDAVRARAKPIIDGALAKGAQAAAGVALLLAGELWDVSGSELSLLAAVTVGAWAVTAWSMRSPYLNLLRRSIAGRATRSAHADPLDVEAAEELVAYLAHERPTLVIGAMNALARRGRTRLIPALVLLHEDPQVLVEALHLFASSRRKDWVPRARRLLADSREDVRMAAARALATQGELEANALSTASCARLRGYAALHSALAEAPMGLVGRADIENIIRADGPVGREEQLGILSAIGDLPATPAVLPLLEVLAARPPTARAWTAELARAVESQKALELIPRLIDSLAVREGREAVGAALRALGAPALEALAARVRDPATPRHSRVHIPGTLAHIHAPQVLGILLDILESDRDGLIRYKALRGLGRFVIDTRTRVDRPRVERLAHANLTEHFRLLGAAAPFYSTPWYAVAQVRSVASEQLLVGLLEDKLRQSLERTFRLLKIAYPREDIEGVHRAYVSPAQRERAAAAELLDTLLRGRHRDELRQLLLVASEESPPGDVATRALPWTRLQPATTVDEALTLLGKDHDATLSALARLHSATVARRPAKVTLRSHDGKTLELEIAATGPR